MINAIRDAAGYLESWLDFQRDRTRLPGVQVAIRVHGELAFSVALGSSNVETGEALTTDHLFHIASHSKTFTATACLQLLEAGKLRLDDDVAMWIPELAGTPTADMTVRELLGHQSGINRDSESSDFWQLLGDFPDREGLLAKLAEDATYGHNEHFKYSNMGYSLLGLVIEAASGESYNDYVRGHIVDALGLRNLGPEVPDERIGELAGAHSVRLAGDDQLRVIPHTPTAAMAAATGFYGTAEDTTAYLSAHLMGRTELVSDDSKRLMQRKESTITRGVTRWYGLGLQMMLCNDRILVGHSGGWPGHITQTFLDPATGVCISVFTNALGGFATDWTLSLFKWIELITDPPAGHEVPEGIDPASFTGRYAQMWSVTDVAYLGGRLLEVAPAMLEPKVASYELVVRDADTLDSVPEAGYVAVGEPLRFERDADGKVVSMRSGGATAWPLEEYRRREGLD